MKYSLLDFNRNGFFFFKNLFSGETRCNLQKFVDWNLSLRILDFGGELNSTTNSNLKDEFMRSWVNSGRPNFDRRNLIRYISNELFLKIVSSSEIIEIGKELLKSKRLFLNPTSNFRYKHKKFPWSGIPPHYDAWYWELQKNHKFRFLTFWLPLQDIGQNSGILKLHEKVKTRYQKDFQNNSDLKKITKTSKGPKNMQFGDLIVFDPYLVHSSKLSESDQLTITLDFRVEPLEGISEEASRFDVEITDDTKGSKSFRDKFVKVIDKSALVNKSSDRTQSPSSFFDKE